MKRYRIAVLLVILVPVLALAAFGSEHDGLDRVQRDAGTLDAYMNKGTDIALRITELTGVALSPLVGLVVIGTIEYYRAKKQGEPVRWYFSLWFMGTIVLVLVLITLKDTIGELAPFFKKPLDALDFVQHKFSGIIAFAIVAPRLVLSILEPVGQTVSYLFNLVNPVAAAWAAGPPTDGITGTVGTLLIVAVVVSAVIAAVFFLTVWLAAGAVETLILLAPIPFVGLILRSFRLSVFGLLMIGAAVSPVIGIVLSFVILYVSYRILGWSVRLAVFGWVIALDTLGGRHHYLRVEEQRHIAAFASSAIRGVRSRSYGRLVNKGASLVFEYRPFGVLSRKSVAAAEHPDRVGIARGTLVSSVVGIRRDHKRPPVLFWLPPRYRGHEEPVARLLGLSPEIHDQRFRKRLKDAWSWIVGQTANGSPEPEAV
ncbi:MAG: hypothetical protein JW765_05485 [Deltaproteobacteria bacterium]|nr:hypothetical protein [Candidatus Zymogenaceae bacterium]